MRIQLNLNRKHAIKLNQPECFTSFGISFQTSKSRSILEKKHESFRQGKKSTGKRRIL